MPTGKNPLALFGGPRIRVCPGRTPLVDPSYLSQEIKEIAASARWTRGDKTARLEQAFADMTGSKHALAVSSGSAGLETALNALRIGPGDEVIVPAATFYSTAGAVLKANAVPVFADIDPETYCIDPDDIPRVVTEASKAIIPVHLWGNPADMPRIKNIAEEYGIKVIEDCAQAPFAEISDKTAGAFGHAGVFSFTEGKILSAGEGGLIVTDSSETYQRAAALIDYGRKPGGHPFIHYIPGANYRMTEFQAAMVHHQLDRLPGMIENRLKNVDHLRQKIKEIPGWKALPASKPGFRSAVAAFVLLIDLNKFAGTRPETVAKALTAEGVPAAPGYPHPVYKNPVFLNRMFDKQECPVSCPFQKRQHDFTKMECPVAEDYCKRTLFLPHPALNGTIEEMDEIAEIFYKVTRYRRFLVGR